MIIESAFTPATSGRLALHIGSTPVTIGVSNPFTHSDWSSFDFWGPQFFTHMPAFLQAVIRSLTGDGDYSVIYSQATQSYTFAHATNNFALDFATGGDESAAFGRVLGFAQSIYSGKSSYTSDAAPLYTIKTEHCRHVVKPDYQTGGHLWGIATNGIRSTFRPAVERKRYHMRAQFEPRSKVFRYLATANNPWTWEEFFIHHKSGHFFFATDESPRPSTAHKLTAEGCALGPSSRIRETYVGEYHIDLKTFIYR